MVCPGWSACTYLKESFIFFFPNVLSLSSEHGVPSVPCIVGALSDVFFFFFFNMTEYQFVLGIPVSSRIQWSCSLNSKLYHGDILSGLARWYRISLKVGKSKMNRTDFVFLTSSSPGLHFILCGVAFASEQDLCSTGARQGSWKQRASVKELT